MLRFELGNGDPKAHDITVVNTPTQAQAATIPTGMDAAIADPSGVPQGAGRDRHRRHHELVRLHRRRTTTVRPAKARASCSSRSRSRRSIPTATTCTARSGSAARKLIGRAIPASSPPSSHGAAGRRRQALDDGSGRGLAARAQVLGARRPSSARRWSRTTCCSSAAGCWPTEGDAAALLETSKYMVEGKLIPKPLAWSQVQGRASRKAACRLKAAYEKTGPQARRRGVPGEGRRRTCAALPAWDGPLDRARPETARRRDRGTREWAATFGMNEQNMNVGFIGLGTMGAPMARNLLKKGHALVVFDVTQARRCRRWSAPARRRRPSPREVAAASRRRHHDAARCARRRARGARARRRRRGPASRARSTST